MRGASTTEGGPRTHQCQNYRIRKGCLVDPFSTVDEEAIVEMMIDVLCSVREFLRLDLVLMTRDEDDVSR